MKQLRKRAGLSQDKFARKLGVATATVASWDQMKNFPRLFPSQILKMMDILDCTLSELQDAEQAWTKYKEEKSSTEGGSND